MAERKQKVSDKEQQESDSDGQRFSYRLTRDEVERVVALQKRLQVRLGKYTRVTQRVLFLESLEALELRLNTLDAKKKKDDE